MASHASWMENFPVSRLEGTVQPSHRQPMVDYSNMAAMAPLEARALIGDGNFGGDCQKPDDVMAALWQIAVAETRALLQEAWRVNPVT